MAAGGPVLSGALRALGRGLLATAASTTVLVVAMVCSVLYAGAWAAAALGGASLAGLGQRLAAQPQPAASTARAPGGAAPGQEQGRPGNATLEVETTSPVTLWVIDGRGAAAGTNPQTDVVQLQIGGVSYSGLGMRPQRLIIPRAEGLYRVQLKGTTRGRYDVGLRLADAQQAERTVERAVTGEVYPHSLLEFTARASLEDGAPKLDVAPPLTLAAGDVPVVATATPTARPSATATPAARSRAPSLTPAPSATPIPAATAAAASGVTTPTTDYTARVVASAQAMRQSVQRMEALMAQPKLGDPDWTRRTTDELALWRRTYAETRHLGAPPRLVAAHVRYLAALQQFDQASYDVTQGLDTLSSAPLDTAGARITKAEALLAEAADLFARPKA